MKILIPLALIVSILLIYALWGRDWLKHKAWAKQFFDWIEPLELVLFKKSETILVGRLLWVGSALVGSYDTLARLAQDLDLTPVTTLAFDLLHVPPDYRSIATTALIGGIGWLINWLREHTTKPLELVAVKEADAPAEVKMAIAEADAAKEQAVATVKAAA